MSDIDRLMNIISKVYDSPEARDEFRVELYKLYKNEPALYEETMADLEKLSPSLHYEMRDFINNILTVQGFIQKAES